MTTEETIARAFMEWRAERAEFMADPSPENLAKLEKASERHVDAAGALTREKRRNSLKAN